MPQRALPRLHRPPQRPGRFRILHRHQPEVPPPQPLHQRLVLLPEPRLPRRQVAHLPHRRLQQLLQTPEARLQRRVHHAPLHRHPEPRRRQQRVLLRVYADAHVVRLPRRIRLRVRAPVTPPVLTVHHLRRRPVVPRAQDPPIPHHHRPPPPPHTASPRPHRHSDPHKVLVGLWSLVVRHKSSGSQCVSSGGAL